MKPTQDDVERAEAMPMTYYAGEPGDGIRTLREIKETIAQAIADARERALEQAAVVCDAHNQGGRLMDAYTEGALDCAAAIRALKGAE